MQELHIQLDMILHSFIYFGVSFLYFWRQQQKIMKILNCNYYSPIDFLCFSAIYLPWRDQTIYVNKFDADDLPHKIYFLVQMVLACFVGVHLAPNNLTSEFGGTVFAASYFCTRIFLVLMHLLVMFFK